jgi:hypothetical protein
MAALTAPTGIIVIGIIITVIEITDTEEEQPIIIIIIDIVEEMAV